MRTMTHDTVTNLGALQPGDVGVFVHDNGVETPRFVFLTIVDRPEWGRAAVVQFEGGGYVEEPWLARPVRRLGRGRIEPARIVMEGEEGETMGIIADLRRKLAEAGVEGSPPPGRDTTIGQWSNRAHNAEEQVRTLRAALEKNKIHCHCVEPANCALCERSAAVLAATAPKENPCTT